MTAATNAEDLWQYKVEFFLIKEQRLTFVNKLPGNVLRH